MCVENISGARSGTKPGWRLTPKARRREMEMRQNNVDNGSKLSVK